RTSPASTTRREGTATTTATGSSSGRSGRRGSTGRRSRRSGAGCASRVPAVRPPLALLALATLPSCRTVLGETRSPRGVLLEDLTWVEAEKVLTRETVVVIPIGAAAKEHGPHLLLKNDWILAEHLKRRVLERCDVVVAPTLAYHFYPA